MITFGPVPSRRLGRSLGVNNIPPKSCSYACAYCQLGRTTQLRVERSSYSDPWEIRQAAQAALISAAEAGEAVDYISFVADGEPTLDANLGRAIDLLRPLGIPTAVISNGSLAWQKDVQEDLMKADWVSLKVDATQEATWRRVDRPHGSLRLGTILDGLLAFAQSYQGTLVTETMLVAGLNDGEWQIEELGAFLAQLKPAVAYLSIPTRPPAERWVRAPGEGTVLRAHWRLSEHVGRVECLTGYEGNAFASTGDAVEDLLSITAVHPMREDAVRELLARAGAGWNVVEGMLAAELLVRLDYEGQRFYLRRLPKGGANDV